MTTLSQFNISGVEFLSEMCYLNGNIVMAGFTPETIRVYHEKNGSVLNEWKSCHRLPRLMGFEVEGKEYLLESCTFCRVIRGYESPETSSSCKIFYEHTEHIAMMCKGPTGTLLLVEKKSIKQLRYSEEKFHLASEFSIKLEEVQDVCYYEKYGIVVVLHEDRETLTGVVLATGQTAWRTKIHYGSPAKFLAHLKNVLIIPDGRVCIFNSRKLVVMDPKNGTIMYELLDFTNSGNIRKIVARTNGFQQIFAVHHRKGPLEETEISIFYLLPDWRLPLRNIISDEKNSKTNE